MLLGWLLVVVLLLAAFVPLRAWATDRYYSDITAFSPDGRLRLEAKSPDNSAGPMRRAFASNFVYTLYQADTNAVIWKREQPKARSKGMPDEWTTEGSPIGAFVHNSGQVAIRTADDQVVMLDTQGRTLGSSPILGSFSPEERERWVSETTAGPMWDYYSAWAFIEATDDAGEPRAYFLVRTMWQRRFLIDARTGTLADSPRLQEQAVRAEAAWAMDMLQRSVKRPPSPSDWAGRSRLAAAVHIAGCQRLAGSIPLLRQMERGKGDWDQYRSGVHLALRRLGEVPRRGPVLELKRWLKAEYGRVPDHQNPLPSTVTFAQRVANAARVVEGITIERLNELVGGPDAQVYCHVLQRHALDYDLDIPGAPETLRVVVGENNTVTHVRRIVPAVWVKGYVREMGYDPGESD